MIQCISFRDTLCGNYSSRNVKFRIYCYENLLKVTNHESQSLVKAHKKKREASVGSSAQKRSTRSRRHAG